MFLYPTWMVLSVIRIALYIPTFIFFHSYAFVRLSLDSVVEKIDDYEVRKINR